MEIVKFLVSVLPSRSIATVLVPQLLLFLGSFHCSGAYTLALLHVSSQQPIRYSLCSPFKQKPEQVALKSPSRALPLSVTWLLLTCRCFPPLMSHCPLAPGHTEPPGSGARPLPSQSLMPWRVCSFVVLLFLPFVSTWLTAILSSKRHRRNPGFLDGASFRKEGHLPFYIPLQSLDVAPQPRHY